MTYCSSLTNRQINNVLRDEYDRMQNLSKESDVYQAAAELYQEAREEMLRRSLEPDQYLEGI